MNKIIKKRKFPTQENLKLNIKSTNIGVHIKGSETNGSELELDMSLNKNLSFEDIFKVEFDEKQNVLNIKTSEDYKCNFHNIDFTVTVPKSTSMEIDSKNGGFKITDISGEINVSSKNGHISLKRVESKNICTTKNGKITLQQAHGDHEIKTKNGSVKLYEVEGKISIEDKNGKLKCIKCKGDMEATAVNGKIRILDSYLGNADIIGSNGSIYYEFNQLEAGKFNFQNKNGKIHLILPADIPYSIKAKNQLGRFYIGLPGNYDKEEKDGVHHLKMTQKSGKVEITAENKRGSIALLDKKNIEKGINFGGFGEEVNEILQKINSEEIREKIHKKLEKAKEKVKKISIKSPEKMDNIEEAAVNLSEEIKDAIKDEDWQKKGKELGNKIKKAVKKFVKDTKNTTAKHVKKEKKSYDEKSQSRLKILQMLEQGKISTEEAEKLLKALEK
ncbi:MAG: hypothetical protein KGY75_01445 [Candidatus Cloacimonetes bacterium]|nr:hypothetical protein [Candidatus Cloacimonadota bacterium]MBS3766776.1 hypothetical protein [Candidatus Cloacimonadota bacterium]